MYCRKCGAEIKETSKFCDNCGCEVVKVKQVSYAEKYNENKKKSISNLLSEYISTRDYIGAYYNENYFKERSKNWNKTNCRNNKIKP